MGAAPWIMQLQQCNKWSFIAPLIQAVRRPCVGLNCFFAATFGSRYWDQACKKVSLGSGLLSLQPCARSMRNTWLGFVHRFTPSAGTVQCVQPRKLSGQRGIPIKLPNLIQNLAQKFQLLPPNRIGLFEPFELFG